MAPPEAETIPTASGRQSEHRSCTASRQAARHTSAGPQSNIHAIVPSNRVSAAHSTQWIRRNTAHMFVGVMQRTSGKSSFAARGQIALTGNPKDTARAEPTSLTHVPTAKELDANPADLNMIKELYGSRAQTIINTLLAFDAYFSWYLYALKDNDASLFCDMDVRERQAFDNCCKAIEMHEVFERLAIRKHKSYLPHAAIFKTSRDILRVGDVWAFSLSALELQNAETKRVDRDSGSRRMKLSTSGQARVSLRAKEGPTRLITTKGYSTTLALSTLRNLLVAQNLRSGDGILSTPESRRKERVFGESGKGRLTLTSAGVKIEKIGADYDPQADTCLKAFVRLLAEVAASRLMLQESEHSENCQFALRAQ